MDRLNHVNGIWPALAALALGAAMTLWTLWRERERQ